MENGQSQQVSAGRDPEQTGVAMRKLQNMACEKCKKGAAQRSRHTADPDHRADHALREHVGGCGEKIGRPTLVRARRNTEQRNSDPY